MSNIFAEYARGSWCMRTSDMKVKRLSFSLAAGDPSSHQTTSTGVKFVVGVAIAISVVALLKLFFGGGVCRSKARLDGKITMSKFYQEAYSADIDGAGNSVFPLQLGLIAHT